MKANEMPERIYLFDYNDAMVTPLEGDTVYVREDAFIEKACDWFVLKYEDIGLRWMRGYDAEEWKEDLKKYMEKSV